MRPSIVLNVVIIVFFLCTGIAVSKDWKDESGKKNRNNSEYDQSHRGKKERPNDHDYESDDRDHRPDDRSHKPDNKGYKSDSRGHKKVVEVKKSHGHSVAVKHRDYHNQKGYREHPHQRGRHYGHYKHKGHQYEYNGHWTSWNRWEQYRRKHKKTYSDGHYYRENSHLMFRFRDPVTGGYFFFSIGK